jgi:hypothetical protein
MAFARPLAADELTLFQGYIVADETAQFVGDKIIVDGSGNGNSTLGTFTITYHFKVNPMTGRGNGSSRLKFANGDTWTTDAIGLGDNTGVGAVASITELHFVTRASGRFADAVGDFRLERMLDQATGKTSGSFKGEFLKTTPKSEHSAIDEARRRIQRVRRGNFSQVPLVASGREDRSRPSAFIIRSETVKIKACSRRIRWATSGDYESNARPISD